MTNLNNKQNYTFPLIIMMLLFFLLGFFTIMSNSMISFLKERCQDVTTFQSQFVNMAFYGAYLLSIPAGYIISKLGYRKGVVVGMLVITLGVGLFIPALGPSLGLFLFPFFMIGLGDVFLNVAVNPYILALGPKETAASRLNLAGGLNSLATVIAPLFVSALIVDRATAFANTGVTDKTQIISAGIFLPAIGAASFALLIAIILMFLKLPEVTAEEEVKDSSAPVKTSVWQYNQVTFGLVAIAMYVTVEVGIPSFLMFYYDEIKASMVMPEWLSFLGTGKTSMLAIYWSGLMVGRFMGSWLNTVFNPSKLLTAFAVISALLVLGSLLTTGNVSFVLMLVIGLFHSIMWPNINDIGLAGIGGSMVKKASGILCTGVAGAAILTLVMGKIADITHSYAAAYSLLFVCYGYIIFYSIRGPKMVKNA